MGQEIPFSKFKTVDKLGDRKHQLRRSLSDLRRPLGRHPHRSVLHQGRPGHSQGNDDGGGGGRIRWELLVALAS